MIKAIFLIVPFLVTSQLNGANGCLGQRSPSKSSCASMAADKKKDCLANTFPGRQQSLNMTLNLYKSLGMNDLMQQENLCLFPLEQMRLMSSLIYSVGDKAKMAVSLNNVRCYIFKFTRLLLDSIMVRNQDLYYGEEEEEEGSSASGTASTTKMVSFNRKLLVGKNVQPDSDYNLEVFCWFGVPVATSSDLVSDLRDWSRDVGSKDKATLSMSPSTIIMPSALKNDKAVMASSIFLKLQWKGMVFRTSPQLQQFKTDSVGRKVMVTMMNTVSKMGHVDKPLYSAVILPLNDSARVTNLILFLPNSASNFSAMESELLASGNSLLNGIQQFHQLEAKWVNLSMPRLSLQITHELTIPVKPANSTNSTSLSGLLSSDEISLYQDVVMEWPESSDLISSNNRTQQQVAATATSVTLDRPFMFVIEVEHDVLAVGRIRNPEGCPLCQMSGQKANPN